MKGLLLIVLCWLCNARLVHGQELFINTEPASNMATKSLGIRLNNYGYKDENGKIRTTFSPEVMYGLSSKIMVHADAFVDDKFTDGYVFRGMSLYAKYRFLNIDGLQKHFRLAAYARASTAFQPDKNTEVSIIDDYSGLNTGIIATQLLHKLAISGGAGYTRIFGGDKDYLKKGDAVDYSLSFGYLALPYVYSNYKQTNMNLIFELLGKTQWAVANGASDQSEHSGYYIDAAPGVQFIIHSRALIDLSWRWQIAGDMSRLWYQQAFVRLEYNIFNL